MPDATIDSVSTGRSATVDLDHDFIPDHNFIPTL